MKTGIEIISDERKRQIEVEEWDADHDEQHDNGELANFAALYAIPDDKRMKAFAFLFPEWWDKKWWKPTPDNRIKELAKAGACIAAEIDRLQAIK